MKRPMLILLVLLLAGAAVCGILQQGELLQPVPAVTAEPAQPTEDMLQQTPPATVTPTDMVEAVG
ncbi:MAG: hypothetical protein IJE07_02290 [Clostridia bacterium]|nr:hypothetical protein [Clostridia bacterium]